MWKCSIGKAWEVSQRQHLQSKWVPFVTNSPATERLDYCIHDIILYCNAQQHCRLSLAGAQILCSASDSITLWRGLQVPEICYLSCRRGLCSWVFQLSCGRLVVADEDYDAWILSSSNEIYCELLLIPEEMLFARYLSREASCSRIIKVSTDLMSGLMPANWSWTSHHNCNCKRWWLLSAAND